MANDTTESQKFYDEVAASLPDAHADRIKDLERFISELRTNNEYWRQRAIAAENKLRARA